MKKYLYMLLFMAVALFSASALVSCGGDDDPEPEPEPLPIAKNYVRYTAKLSEDIFEYCDVTVTFEADGKKDTYTFGEDTKVSDMEISDVSVQKKGRVLEITAYPFDAHPLKVSTDIKLSEAGKQKVAKATTEEMDLVFFLNFGECNEKGQFSYHDEPVFMTIINAGVHVKELETVIEDINQTFKEELNKTFK